MTIELPSIVKDAERLLAEIEKAVLRFSRYHKYSHGLRLRDQAMHVAQQAHRAWRDKRCQTEWTDKLIWAVDDLKLSLALGKTIEAFASFAQFEMLAKLASDLGRQCGGWRKQQRLNSQNGAAKQSSFQRAEILSSPAASEARP